MTEFTAQQAMIDYQSEQARVASVLGARRNREVRAIVRGNEPSRVAFYALACGFALVAYTVIVTLLAA